jgi:hypothetical protein
MPSPPDRLLLRAGESLTSFAPQTGGSLRIAIDRWLADAAAARFHLGDSKPAGPMLLGIFGGTGTGKSTLVNRLLGQNLSAASFRRTFTSGPIAIAGRLADMPDNWLGVEHFPATAADFPLRGKPGSLLMAEAPTDLTARITLIATPDLDGDQPAHHAEADRVFRWVQAVLFLVTPEKYQMTELLPYYRLAQRYALPRCFVMNKADNQSAVDDYRTQLGETAGGAVFVIARDDAGFEPVGDTNLAALQQAVSHMAPPESAEVQRGRERRVGDLMGRLTDQIIAPARERRLIADRLAAALRAMETPLPGVDVNPVTQQLRQRLQQRSILYLIGPQRVLDRVRQAPALLSRLPRVAWDYLRSGEISADAFAPPGGGKPGELPDFGAILTDQFAVVQSRIDDVVRGSPAASSWLTDPIEGAVYSKERFDPTEAGKIAAEEIADLRAWLEKRWDATPRDTRIVMALLKYLPGGRQITGLAEAAPYLLAAALVVHHALFGVDLLVLGGYSLATWLSERISNEVSSRTRAANQRIADRFTRLAHEQIERTCRWLNQRAPSYKTLEQLETLTTECAPIKLEL